MSRLLLVARVPLRPFFSRLVGGVSHGRSTLRVSHLLLPDHHVRVFPSKPPLLNGCRVFCTNQDLAIKKCVPCSSTEMRAMTEQAASDFMSKVPGWNLVTEGDTLKLNRSWKVKSFTKGLEFFQAVAEVAEAEGHHPDLHLVGWNNVKIDIWTHAVGGLTENDFILAAKINMLNLQHLLRRKAILV